MRSQSLTPEQVLTLLAETPQCFAALTADLAPEELQTRPTPDEWSANEVLAHLRAGADVWGNCMVAMIAEDRPVLVRNRGINHVEPGETASHVKYPHEILSINCSRPLLCGRVFGKPAQDC